MDRLDTGTPAAIDMKSVQSEGVAGEVPMDTSALGEGFDATPMVLPVRGHLDSVRRLLQGDVYIGRGSRQRALPWSRYCNNFEVSEHGRDAAIAGFRDMLLQDGALYASSWTLSGTRPVCHCPANERCHGDMLVEEFRRTYPAAYDRADCLGALPEARVMLQGCEKNQKVMKARAPTKGYRASLLNIAELVSPCESVWDTSRGICATDSRLHPLVAGTLLLVFTCRRITGIVSRMSFSVSRIITAPKRSWSRWRWGKWTSARFLPLMLQTQGEARR